MISIWLRDSTPVLEEEDFVEVEVEVSAEVEAYLVAECGASTDLQEDSAGPEEDLTVFQKDEMQAASASAEAQVDSTA